MAEGTPPPGPAPQLAVGNPAASLQPPPTPSLISISYCERGGAGGCTHPISARLPV